MIEVRFLFGIEDEPDADELTYISVDELIAGRDKYESVLSDVKLGLATGTLEIVADGSATQIKETLRYLILELCFRALPPLLGGDEFAHKWGESGMDITMRPRGEAVDISGKYIAPLTCLRVDLATSLFACGTKYLKFLRDLGAHPADIEVLEVVAVKARSALAHHLTA